MHSRPPDLVSREDGSATVTGMSASNLEGVIDDPVPHLADADPAVRRLALAACSGRLSEPSIREAVETCLATDRDGAVRAAAVEVLAEVGATVFELIFEARLDEDPRVIEAAATGLGEIGEAGAVPWLMDAATGHQDRLVREAAVAALGAIGDPGALPVLLDVVATGPPQVRRRAVVALTVFDDESIEPALRMAAEDRNPMVREVAVMVVGQPSSTTDSEDIAVRRPGGDEPP
jgi:HEAT repeat protein